MVVGVGLRPHILQGVHHRQSARLPDVHSANQARGSAPALPAEGYRRRSAGSAGGGPCAHRRVWTAARGSGCAISLSIGCHCTVTDGDSAHRRVWTVGTRTRGSASASICVCGRLCSSGVCGRVRGFDVGGCGFDVGGWKRVRLGQMAAGARCCGSVLVECGDPGDCVESAMDQLSVRLGAVRMWGAVVLPQLCGHLPDSLRLAERYCEAATK